MTVKCQITTQPFKKFSDVTPLRVTHAAAVVASLIKHCLTMLTSCQLLEMLAVESQVKTVAGWKSPTAL